MRLGSQGGSQTVSTWQDVTPGTPRTAFCTCSGSSCALGQAGAVSVISTLHPAIVGDLHRVDQPKFVDVHRDFRIIDGGDRLDQRVLRWFSPGISPSGVQAVRVGVISFTACLLGAVQRGDQRMPGKRRAFHPGRIFVHAGQRRQPLHRFGQVAARNAGRCRCGPCRETPRTAPWYPACRGPAPFPPSDRRRRR